MADRKSSRRDKRKSAPAPRGFTLSHAWAAAILGVLVVVFFHDVFVGGKTFVSPDATAPLGFGRMGEQSLWRDHVYPMWNPYVFLGMPSFASGAYNPLIYPPDWPLALVQKVVPLPEMTWLLLYYALGAWCFYLLAREWGARAEGALIGAAAFIFAPNLVAVGSHGHGSQLVDSAYLPLMLWLAARWLRRGGAQDLGALAIAGGFQMLRGHVQICFYTWLAIGLLGVVTAIGTLRDRAVLLPRLSRIALLGVAAALAFGIAGFYNLPLQDYSRWSIRGGGPGGGVGMTYATQWSLAPIELPTIVLPAWAGFGGATYWGGMPFTDYPNAYVGMITIVLAIPAFFTGGAVRAFALALAALSLLVAFGHHAPFYAFLYAHLPLFNKFRVPVMVIVLFQLAAALGLAWGWSALLATEDDTARARRVRGALIATAVALAVGLLFGVLGRESWHASYIRLAMTTHGDYSAPAAAAAYAGLVGDIARVCLLGLLATGVAWLAFARRLNALAATALALALLLFELWPVSGSVMRPVIGEATPRNADAGRDDVVDFLQQAGPPGSFRIVPFDEFQDNRFAGFGIASLGGYHAAKPRLFQDFMDSSLVDKLGWLRLLNVRYLVFRQPLAQVPSYLKLAHQGAGGVVYENLIALPRVMLLSRYRVVVPAHAILDSVKLGTSDAAAVTFLEKDRHLTLSSATGGSASIASYRLNDVTVDVSSPGAALLRLADLWYPDWTATVDGRPADVLKADYLLRAVPVPAGRHRVVFRFRSSAVRTGLALSIVSFAAGVALVVLGLWGARRRAAPEAA